MRTRSLAMTTGHLTAKFWPTHVLELADCGCHLASGSNGSGVFLFEDIAVRAFFDIRITEFNFIVGIIKAYLKWRASNVVERCCDLGRGFGIIHILIMTHCTTG